jgi:hypothetical protein
LYTYCLYTGYPSMSYEISASQVSELKKTGRVQFVDFITETEVAILKHPKKERDSFQECPLSKKILSNHDLGKLLYELLHKRPIRLVMSKKIKANDRCDLLHISIDEVYLGMFLSFEDKSVLFFTKEFIPHFESEGILAVYGEARARYIKKEEDPESVYLLKQGYASGDKLLTSKFPFVYK